MLQKFKKIMMIINGLMAVPVIYVIIKEIISPEPVRPARIVATALLMAIPLGSTIAITITGSAVLDD